MLPLGGLGLAGRLPLARVSVCDPLPDWVSSLGCDARFNTQLFLFLFLPVALLGYWAVASRNWKIVWIAACSIVFYSMWDARFVLLLATAAAVDFYVALRIEAAGEDRPRRKRWLFASILFNLGILAIFKYALFARDNAQSLFDLLGVDYQLPGFSIVLPVGISFFTFKTLSYTIDVYRGDQVACREPLKYLAFISLFPELVAGPIVRYSTLGEQLDRLPRRVPWNFMATGVTLFAIGLFKKAVVADLVANRIDDLWAAPGALTFAQGWAAALGYTVQLYFDFSGYSDMAMGLGAMLGLRFPINFLAPYQALNPSDFWRRWHISLSTWLRDYLYIPLGGNRKGPGRAKVNLLLVMLLGGLWHGANWTFVAWGAYHGVLLVLYQTVRPGWDRMPAIAQRLLMFLLAVVGWVTFRATSLGQAMQVYGAMVDVASLGSLVALLPFLLALAAIIAFTMLARPTGEMQFRFTAPRAFAVALLLFAAVLMVGSGSSPFLYYQF
ncbi:MAG: alginate O-acetyltransferase complex protein AlgI [Thermoplasmata archaeon]|nr:alginate O-acetyltransferase complex protein AlgI [Thermoplasmata archaeon]